MNVEETPLEEALRALASPAPGDWIDVLNRQRQRSLSARRRLQIGIVLAVVSLLIAGSAVALGVQFLGWFKVTRSIGPVPVAADGETYILGRVLHVGAETFSLRRPLLAPLLGQDARLVVKSTDGRQLAYHTWSDDMPLIEVVDTQTGEQRTLAVGAQTIAWSLDGRVAYAQATPSTYQPGQPFLRRVVVATGSGSRQFWTAAATIDVIAWSDRELLIQVLPCLLESCPSKPEPGIYALRGPGQLRRLPISTVAAVSPDGRYAIGRFDSVAGDDAPSASIRVVDISNRQSVDTLDLTSPARRAGLRGLRPGSLQSAAWRGRDIVATFSGRDSALMSLRFEDGELRVRQVDRLTSAALPSRYGVSFGAPTFVDADTVMFVAHATRRNDRAVAAVLSCSLSGRTCMRGRLLRPREWIAIAGTPVVRR